MFTVISFLRIALLIWHFGIVGNPCINYANELNFYNLVWLHIVNYCWKFIDYWLRYGTPLFSTSPTLKWYSGKYTSHVHHNASCLHSIHIGLCMEHLNKLNKSINSKRLAATPHRRSLYPTTTWRRTSTPQCNLRHSRANARSISRPSTVICLHYKLYRAEHRRSGPSLPPLGGPGPHEIWVGRARSKAFTLLNTKPGSAPYCVAGFNNCYFWGSNCKTCTMGQFTVP